MLSRFCALAVVVLLAINGGPQGARAANHVLYLGGGGDAPGKSTMFDSDASLAGQYFKNEHWDIGALYDGGHSESETIAKESFGPQTQPFSQASLNQLITQTKKAIEKGSFRRGDQFLIVVDSHGSSKKPGEKAHSVSSSVIDSKGMAEQVSLDSLASLRDELQDKAGVRVAIIDLSCHSGNALALANDKTCVISASSPDSIANNFSKGIFLGLRPKRNLEEIYLRAREELVAPSIPEISTAAGNEASSILRPIYKRISYNSKETPYFGFTDLVKNEVMQDPIDCSYEIKKDKKIEKLFQEASESLNYLSFGAKTALLEGLKTSIGGYEVKMKDFAKVLQDLKNLEASVGQKIEAIPLSGPKGIQAFFKASWLALAHLDQQAFDETKKNWTAIAQDTTQSREVRGNYLKNLQALDLEQKRRQELIAAQPQFRQMVGLLEKRDRLEEEAYVMAKEVNHAERGIYSAMYLLHDEAGEPNPCRDFVL